MRVYFVSSVQWELYGSLCTSDQNQLLLQPINTALRKPKKKNKHTAVFLFNFI